MTVYRHFSWRETGWSDQLKTVFNRMQGSSGGSKLINVSVNKVQSNLKWVSFWKLLSVFTIYQGEEALAVRKDVRYSVGFNGNCSG